MNSYLDSCIKNIPWDHNHKELLTAFYNNNCQYFVDYRPVKGVSLIMQLCSFKEHLSMKETYYLKENFYISQIYNNQKYFISLLLNSINLNEFRPSVDDLYQKALWNFYINRKKANNQLAFNRNQIQVACYFCCQNFLKEVIFPIYLNDD